MDIDGRVAMTSRPRESCATSATSAAPNRVSSRSATPAGRPGQLEGELAHGFLVQPRRKTQTFVFDDDRDELWDHAMKRRTQDL